MSSKAELEAKIELLEAEASDIARMGEENKRLKIKVAQLIYRKQQLTDEVQRLKAALKSCEGKP